MSSEHSLTFLAGDSAAALPAGKVAAGLAAAFRSNSASRTASLDVRPLTIEQLALAVNSAPIGYQASRAEVSNSIAIDVAMLAEPPPGGSIILTTDPFRSGAKLAELLNVAPDSILVRIHDALLFADKVVAVGADTFASIAPMVPNAPVFAQTPPLSLQLAAGEPGEILVVDHGISDPEAISEALCTAFPAERFVFFDEQQVFAHSWKLAIHLDLACRKEPGARLGDAWCGGVPVLQLVDQAVPARLERATLNEDYVESGITGLLAHSCSELLVALEDLLADDVLRRALARAAVAKFDLVGAWSTILQEVM